MYISIHQRLKEYISFKKIRPLDFGKKFGARANEISNWTNDTKMSMYRMADMLRAFPDLNMNWLLTGEGEMLTTTTPPGSEYRNPNNTGTQIIQEPTSPYNKRIAELEDDKARLKEYNDFLKQQLGERGDWPGKDVEGGVENPAKTG